MAALLGGVRKRLRIAGGGLVRCFRYWPPLEQLSPASRGGHRATPSVGTQPQPALRCGGVAHGNAGRRPSSLCPAMLLRTLFVLVLALVRVAPATRAQEVHRSSPVSVFIQHGDTLTWLYQRPRPADGSGTVLQDTLVFLFRGDSTFRITPASVTLLPPLLGKHVRAVFEAVLAKEHFDEVFGLPPGRQSPQLRKRQFVGRPDVGVRGGRGILPRRTGREDVLLLGATRGRGCVRHARWHAPPARPRILRGGARDRAGPEDTAAPVPPC